MVIVIINISWHCIFASYGTQYTFEWGASSRTNEDPDLIPQGMPIILPLIVIDDCLFLRDYRSAMTHDHVTAINLTPKQPSSLQLAYRKDKVTANEDSIATQLRRQRAENRHHSAEPSATRFTKSPEINTRQSQEKKKLP
jgi:hypothetical protein